MNSHSFAAGQSTNVPTNGKTVQPYDRTLSFNKIVETRKDKDSHSPTAVYSIDPTAFLKTLELDQLSDLYKITLAGQNIRGAVCIWDTLFNNATRQAMSACVFTANSEFRPIPQSRVSVTSQFLNFSLWVSRINLSNVIAGDRIGIGVNDMAKNKIYVLLYVIDDVCSVASSEVDVEGRSSLLPAVNIRMEHAFQFDYEGNGNFVNMEDDNPYDAEKAGGFVQWIMNTVQDVSTSYPYKPHFLPVTTNGFNREEIESRLLSEKESAESISFSDFEFLCRKIYRDYKDRQPGREREDNSRSNKKTRRRPSARPRREIVLPIIEVMTVGDKFFIKFDYVGTFKSNTLCLDKSELPIGGATETFLTNEDLKGSLVDELSHILVLSEDKFGKDAYVRYFSLNF